MRFKPAALLIALCAVLLLLAPACKSTKSIDPGPSTDAPTGIQPAEPEEDTGAEELPPEGWGDRDIKEDEVQGTDEMDELEAGRSVMQTVYFAFDSSALSDTALRSIEANVRWLKGYPDVRVVVEGHCDERGTTEYNRELGARRARAVVDHMSRLGIDAGRVETISFGEEQPVDRGHDEAAWSKNRRAEFRLERM